MEKRSIDSLIYGGYGLQGPFAEGFLFNFLKLIFWRGLSGPVPVRDASAIPFQDSIAEGYRTLLSEAWGPPQFQEKHSLGEKAILGALGEFRGILGAALGIRNSILGMASHTT